MAFVDRVLTCIDCKVEFMFSAEEQAFFQSKHFNNDPKRCKSCKAKQNGRKRGQVETVVTCDGCGKKTTVPFKPTQRKPVFCRECFQKGEITKPAEFL